MLSGAFILLNIAEDIEISIHSVQAVLVVPGSDSTRCAIFIEQQRVVKCPAESHLVPAVVILIVDLDVPVSAAVIHTSIRIPIKHLVVLANLSLMLQNVLTSSELCRMVRSGNEHTILGNHPVRPRSIKNNTRSSSADLSLFQVLVGYDAHARVRNQFFILVDHLWG